MDQRNLHQVNPSKCVTGRLWHTWEDVNARKFPITLIDPDFGEQTGHRVRKSLEEEELVMN
jgi:hypothetical protein